MGIVPTPESDHARFWAMVDKHGPIPEACPELGPCWLWTGGVDGAGYGQFRLCGKTRRTHVVSYEWCVGPTNGLQVHHHCNIRHCVNPAHLSTGTQKRNIEYAVGLGRMASGERHWTHTTPERLARGATHGKAKMTPDDVREIRRLAVDGVLQAAIAERFGVHQTCISMILRGKTWRHVV